MKNPVRANCMIQQGQLTDVQVRHLESQLVMTYRHHFGSEWQVRVVWLSLPPGQAFVEGRPSRSSTIQIAVPDGTDDDKRHAFMRDVSRFWLGYTGCTRDELVLSVPDESYALRFLQANMDRFDPRLHHDEFQFYVGPVGTPCLFTRLRLARRCRRSSAMRWRALSPACTAT